MGFNMSKSITLNNIDKEGKRIFITGVIGSNIFSNIIPEALNIFKTNPEYNQIIMEDINSVTFTLEKGYTLEKAIEVFEEARLALKEEKMRKRMEYEASPEGQAELKKIVEQNALEEAYRIKDFKELYTAISKLPVTDLKSSETSMRDALNFCEKLMVIFSKCDRLKIEDNQLEPFNRLLKEKGACTYHNAASKFLPKANVKMTIEDTLTQNGTLYFPLSALLQIIDKPSAESVNIGLSMMSDGGEKHSWCMKWVNSQKSAEQEMSQ